MAQKAEPILGLNYGWNLAEDGWKAGMDYNLKTLSTFLGTPIVEDVLNDPPATTYPQEVFIVGDNPTGDWATHSGEIARKIDGAWIFWSPKTGMTAFVKNQASEYRYDGLDWVSDGNSGLVDGSLSSRKLSELSQNLATTSGLTFGYKGGFVRLGNSLVEIAAGTVALQGNTTNFVELDTQGQVTSNIVGFTAGRLALFEVTTSTEILTVSDRRSWVYFLDLSAYLTRPGINNQTGTSYTLVLSDDNTVVRCANASAINVTVPAEATTDFPVGAIIQVRQVDAGQVTLVADTGVTLITPETLKTRKQGSTIALMKVGADEWDVTGDMEGAV